MTDGYLYCFSNQSMPGILKVGMTEQYPEIILNEANSYDTYVYKSKFISDYLYTISSKYVMVSTILDPETILDQVQIGTSRDLDMPTDVEPTEVVNPD